MPKINCSRVKEKAEMLSLFAHEEGTVGYVPQAATVFNATLRDNVLFGKPYDPVLYSQVLEACELVKDISTFPARDHTEIGEKGYNLSGGQKQRVCLARAAYHQCSIYVLDDPLSALDPHVRLKLFKKLLGKGGMLKDKVKKAYEELKSTVLKRLELSEQSRLRQFLSFEVLGDQLPSKQLHRLRQLLGQQTSEEQQQPLLCE
ncbi:hypothetical protein HPB51_003067 [Rhipicephalus microplus]|uniref:ABC transporter domain-containing protein n=1 Tax=Rhipicephalus microplus TaxID=6941 RepID=A0A9J6E5Y9_RHIMP|nr:hypothetical protein HPB51_003067 [Rhipicephalus microplus]